MGETVTKRVEPELNEDFKLLLEASRDFQEYASVVSYSTARPLERSLDDAYRMPPQGLVIYANR